MTTSAETKLGRLKFRARMRREMIDQNEREIERRKSYNRTLKEQLKQINREINFEMRRAPFVSARTPVAI